MPATSRSGPNSRQPGMGTPSSSAANNVTAALRPSSSARSMAPPAARRPKLVTRTRSTRSSWGREGRTSRPDRGAAATVTAPFCEPVADSARKCGLQRGRRSVQRAGGELDQRDRNNGGGLDTEDARAQADDLETGMRRRGDLFFRESTFGADEQADGRG